MNFETKLGKTRTKIIFNQFWFLRGFWVWCKMFSLTNKKMDNKTHKLSSKLRSSAPTTWFLIFVFCLQHKYFRIYVNKAKWSIPAKSDRFASKTVLSYSQEIIAQRTKIIKSPETFIRAWIHIFACIYFLSLMYHEFLPPCQYISGIISFFQAFCFLRGFWCFFFWSWVESKWKLLLLTMNFCFNENKSLKILLRGKIV